MLKTIKVPAEIFKAYDVRGIYPEQINADVARRVAEAYVAVRQVGNVAVGGDVRLSTPELKQSLIDTLVSSGVDVMDIGTITTDQLYFAVGQYELDGGISVTASHNPGQYNGFKFSERGGAPIDSVDLLAMQTWAVSDQKIGSGGRGDLSRKNIMDDYIERVLDYVDTSSIKPLRVAANANFGGVGRGVDKLAERLNLHLDRLNWAEDGTFPKGPPNPLLPENRDEMIELVKKTKPDLGVAWDADADRVFFFTGEGIFVPSPFIIALLAQEFLKKHPGAVIVHDLTTSWVIDDVVTKAGGKSIANRTGHTFIKARMRQEDAIFAGESSGHYYFKDTFYADNGAVPFLMILELVSKSGKSLGELVEPLMARYKISGEINFELENAAKVLKAIEKEFGAQGKIDRTDGLVIESDKWRFSVRTSNTEPLMRLNSEARSQEQLDELLSTLKKIIAPPPKAP